MRKATVSAVVLASLSGSLTSWSQIVPLKKSALAPVGAVVSGGSAVKFGVASAATPPALRSSLSAASDSPDAPSGYTPEFSAAFSAQSRDMFLALREIAQPSQGPSLLGTPEARATAVRQLVARQTNVPPSDAATNAARASAELHVFPYLRNVLLGASSESDAQARLSRIEAILNGVFDAAAVQKDLAGAFPESWTPQRQSRHFGASAYDSLNRIVVDARAAGPARASGLHALIEREGRLAKTEAARVEPPAAKTAESLVDEVALAAARRALALPLVPGDESGQFVKRLELIRDAVLTGMDSPHLAQTLAALYVAPDPKESQALETRQRHARAERTLRRLAIFDGISAAAAVVVAFALAWPFVMLGHALGGIYAAVVPLAYLAWGYSAHRRHSYDGGTFWGFAALLSLAYNAFILGSGLIVGGAGFLALVGAGMMTAQPWMGYTALATPVAAAIGMFVGAFRRDFRPDGD